MKSEKGSALVTAILVVLVLTMVGLAAVLYMTVEQRISSTDDLAKAALYAAESGLKRGEQLYPSIGASSLSTMLAHVDATYNDPSNITTLAASDLYGTTHLGAIVYSSITSGTPLVWQAPTGFDWHGTYRVYYSLYVRNDPSDHLTTDANYLVDHNSMIVMISRGIVTDSAGYDPLNPTAVKILYQKILAEQFGFGTNVQNPSQLRVNAGGWASGLY